jgi:hypothetical protein
MSDNDLYPEINAIERLAGMIESGATLSNDQRTALQEAVAKLTTVLNRGV